MLTMIECFDIFPIKNLIGCLQLRPEKLIFLGEERRMQKVLPRYRAFLKNKGLEPEIVTVSANPLNMDDMLRTLREILRKEESCVIDLSGGEDAYIMAAGALLAGATEEERKKITVQKYDIRRNRMLDFDGDGRVIRGGTASLTAEELILLHGGRVFPLLAQPPLSFTAEKLEGLWRYVRKDPRGWNRNISVLHEFEKRSASETEIFLSKENLPGGIANYKEKERTFRRLIQGLGESGVVTFLSREGLFHYRYTDSVLQEAVEKAGNALEMKALLEARELTENGEAYFSDCRMSVTIDWDGEISEREIPETRNEIDVLLMRGVTPLFVSCKNGSIGDEELYKLCTVARRFGMGLAKKMLIATDLEGRNSMSGRAFLQRAQDMGVYVVPNAAELSRREWAEAFKNAMEN